MLGLDASGKTSKPLSMIIRIISMIFRYLVQAQIGTVNQIHSYRWFQCGDSAIQEHQI